MFYIEVHSVHGSVQCYNESSDDVGVVNIVSFRWIPVKSLHANVALY
jgi:hypothetical protein